jgi:hypothetical protein
MLTPWRRVSWFWNEMGKCRTRLRHIYIFSLEVLQNSADCPCCGCESRVKAVNIDLLGIGLLLDTEPDFKITALVIGAVPTSKLA